MFFQQEINLDHCPVWVQIHGLPLDRSNGITAKCISNAIGEIPEIEGNPEKHIWCVPFLR